MLKTKLILRPGEFTSFTSHYLEPLWKEYFDIEIYDPDKTYPKNTLFGVWWMNAKDTWCQEQTQRGYKIVVDHLWEMPYDFPRDYYYISNSNWFWYNESLWWRDLGYHNYTPNKQIKKLAMMSIRQPRAFRRQIINQLNSRLDNFIWSFGNKKLPDDADPENPNYQRYLNPQWYDQTWMSVIVETDIVPERAGFLTEKTFKAMAYYHPFLLIGSQGMLKTLKSLGFESFENLFDESYDTLPLFEQRLSAIIKQIDCAVINDYDALTQQKLKHNHCHFFDQALVTNRMVKEIIEPLLHYAET